MLTPRKPGQAAALEKLLQGLDADFFEKDDVIVAVILKADPTFVGAAAALRFDIKFGSDRQPLVVAIFWPFSSTKCAGVRVMIMVFHSGPRRVESGEK
jgi:hypothetical protein